MNLCPEHLKANCMKISANCMGLLVDRQMILWAFFRFLRHFETFGYTKEFIRLMVRNQTAADCLSRVCPLQADAAFLRRPRSSRQLAGGWRLAYARDRNSGTANKRRIALPRGQSVTPAWNRSLDSNNARDTLNYGTKEGRPSQSMPVGHVTTATIGNLNDATSYYFTVRPRNRMGFENLPSNEVAHRTLDAAASRLTANSTDPLRTMRLDAVSTGVVSKVTRLKRSGRSSRSLGTHVSCSTSVPIRESSRSWPAR